MQGTRTTITYFASIPQLIERIDVLNFDYKEKAKKRQKNFRFFKLLLLTHASLKKEALNTLKPKFEL